MRVGFGFDSHLFSKKGTLVFGGLPIKACPALKGHSDGDALLHALIDALLGAAGLGDIGEFFPDTDKKWKGASSQKMLAFVLKKIRRKKFKPRQVDFIVVADRPKLTPLKPRLKKKVAGLLGIKTADVNMKAKTPEGLNLFKKPGGIAVWCVATLG